MILAYSITKFFDFDCAWEIRFCGAKKIEIFDDAGDRKIAQTS